MDFAAVDFVENLVPGAGVDAAGHVSNTEGAVALGQAADAAAASAEWIGAAGQQQNGQEAWDSGLVLAPGYEAHAFIDSAPERHRGHIAAERVGDVGIDDGRITAEPIEGRAALANHQAQHADG